MTNRKPITKKARFEVFKRDEFTCQYCGATPPSVVLEVDHILPVAAKGTNATDNLITSCFNCNRGKGATSLESIPPTVAEKSAALKEAESQLKAYYRLIKAKQSRIENEAWDIVARMDSDAPQQGFRRDWLASIKMFIGRLGYMEVADSMEKAVSKKGGGQRQTFLYFCGICWRKIKDGNDG